MTLFKNTGQSALTTGTAITTGNFALPDQYTVVTPGTGGTITVVDEASAPGLQAVSVVPAAATAGYFGFTGMAGASNAFGTRFLWKCPTLPSTGQVFGNLRSSGGGTSVAGLGITASGTLTVTSDADAGVTNGATVATFTPGTWYDLELLITNATTSTGTATLTARDLAGASITNGTVNITGGNFGTSAIGTLRLGKTSAAGNLAAQRFKYVSAQTGSASSLPQPGVNLAPTTAAITPQIKASGQTASFTAVANDADGSVTTHAWTVERVPLGASTPTLSGATTATVTTSTLTTAGSYVLGYVPTDAEGTPGAKTFAVAHIPKASGVAAVPYSVISNVGAWTAGGTATGILDGVDGDSTDYILTPSNPTAASIVLGIEVPATGSYTLDFYFDWTAADGTTQASGVNGTIKGQIFMGTTPITGQQSFSNTSNAPVHMIYAFTAPENAALTDLKDIRLELICTQA